MVIMEAPETIDMMICLKEICVLYLALPENVPKVLKIYINRDVFVY